MLHLLLFPTPFSPPLLPSPSLSRLLSSLLDLAPISSSHSPCSLLSPSLYFSPFLSLLLFLLYSPSTSFLFSLLPFPPVSSLLPFLLLRFPLIPLSCLSSPLLYSASLSPFSSSDLTSYSLVSPTLVCSSAHSSPLTQWCS